MLKIVAGLLTLFISLPLYAETDEDTLWYEVEIIIFDHNQQPEKMSEIWPADPGTPNYSRSQLLTPAPIEIETVAAEITEQLLLDSGITRIFLASPEQLDASYFDVDSSDINTIPDFLGGNSIINGLSLDDALLEDTLDKTTTFEPQDQPLTSDDESLDADSSEPDNYSMVDLIYPESVFSNDEMIAFQNNTSLSIPQTQQTGLTVDLVEQRPDEIIPFQMLKEKELQLAEDYRRLVESEHYTPRMHFGWRQPIKTAKNSLPVLIYRDMLEKEVIVDDNVDTEAAIEGEVETSDPELMPGKHSTPIQDEPFRNGNIEGTITISAGKYLHIDTDLLYFNQSRPPRGAFSFFGALKKETTPDVYRIKQSRRVKASEVHYFDHPMFGVLTVIRPYELPKTEEDEDTLLNLKGNQAL